jgi:TolA protein
MKKTLIISLCLHFIIFLFYYVGISNPFRRVIKDDGLMVVDFAMFSTKTTAPIISNEIPEEKPDLTKPIQPEQTEPAPAKKEEIPEIFEEKAATKTEEKPEPQKEEIKKDDAKIDQTEQKKEELPSKDVDALNIKKEKQKEKDSKKEDQKDKKQEKKDKDDKKDLKKQEAENKKKKQDGVKKAEIDLDKKDKKNVKSDKKSDKKKKQTLDDLFKDDPKNKKNGKKSNAGAQAEEVSDAFTASEIALLKTHISKCWNVHAGAKGAKDHVIDIEIHLSEDGLVQKADIVDKDRMKSDPFYRVAAETAQRSLLDPECNPLPIPKSDYKKWKEITFRFDPKDMF